MSRRGQHKRGRGGKLSLLDAVGMAIGGMVGGGIFAVLGEAVTYSGNAAFIGFGIAGVLALLTGVSYARLTTTFQRSGGAYVFVSRIAGRAAGGTVSWFLLLGYVFTLSLYSHTFGAYGAGLFGLGANASGWLGVGILALLTVINLLGVRAAGLTEDILVYTKLAILLMTAGAGALVVTRAQALPIFEGPALGVVGTAALIFVAYEGFQLLAYDYDVIANAKVTLPRALFVSIPLVTALYMIIAFVATGTLADDVIASHRETVLAYVAQPKLGVSGVAAVEVAALLSTASAVNATVFAQARLAGQVARDGELPRALLAWEAGGVPGAFAIVASAIAAVVQYLGTLNQITTFASMVFLLVFASVNLAACVHRSFSGWRRLLPLLGLAGCFGAAGFLTWNTYHDAPRDLWVIGGIALGLVVLRGLHLALRRGGGEPPDAAA